MLNPEGRGEEFGHFTFDELPPITTKQEGSTVSVNQRWYVSIKLYFNQIKILQQEDSEYSEVVKKYYNE